MQALLREANKKIATLEEELEHIRGSGNDEELLHLSKVQSQSNSRLIVSSV